MLSGSRFSAIYRTFRNYRLKKIIFVQPHRTTSTSPSGIWNLVEKHANTHLISEWFLKFQALSPRPLSPPHAIGKYHP